MVESWPHLPMKVLDGHDTLNSTGGSNSDSGKGRELSTSVENRQAYYLLQDYAPSRPSGLPPAEGVPRMVALQLAAMAASSIALGYLMIRFSSILESLGSWGYVGVAAAEFSNSAMIIVPTPRWPTRLPWERY